MLHDMDISTDTEIHMSPGGGTHPETPGEAGRGLQGTIVAGRLPLTHRGPQTHTAQPGPFGLGKSTVLLSHTLDPWEAYTSGQQARPLALSSLR